MKYKLIFIIKHYKARYRYNNLMRCNLSRVIFLFNFVNQIL